MFQYAQILFSSYNPLEPDSSLEKTLFETIDSPYLDKYFKNSVRKIYNSFILKYYPNETTVKSSFINQVILKTKKHVTIFELPIGSSRADLCKINGESISFEIKTDLDNQSRLLKQLYDYSEIFDKVYIICSVKKLDSIIKFIPESVGIYTYHYNRVHNLKFIHYRKALQSENINHIKQLQLLQKKELLYYFNIEGNYREQLIDKILNIYTSNQINTVFKTVLKNRYKKQWEFIQVNHNNILEIDYQWFFKNTINPNLIYKDNL